MKIKPLSNWCMNNIQVCLEESFGATARAGQSAQSRVPNRRKTRTPKMTLPNSISKNQLLNVKDPPEVREGEPHDVREGDP